MTSGILAGIERWPLQRLVPYARNARTHSEDQIAQIAASIVEFGWLKLARGKQSAMAGNDASGILDEDLSSPLPALSERLHRGLARRLVSMRRASSELLT
jgi:hypothetical protein